MKKCNTCGEINKDNAKFCIKCGEQFSNIEKPVIGTGRNRNFKIFMGLIGGFTAIAVIVLLLVFVIDISNLTSPFKSTVEAEQVEEDEPDDLKETSEDARITIQKLDIPGDTSDANKAAETITKTISDAAKEGGKYGVSSVFDETGGLGIVKETGVVSGMVYIRINFTDLDYKLEVDAPISGSMNLETREINAQAGEEGEIKLTGILSADSDRASGIGSEGVVWSVSI